MCRNLEIAIAADILTVSHSIYLRDTLYIYSHIPRLIAHSVIDEKIYLLHFAHIYFTSNLFHSVT